MGAAPRVLSYLVTAMLLGVAVHGPLGAPPAMAASAAFERRVDKLGPQAKKKGISRKLFQRAFGAGAHDPEALAYT